MLATVLVINPRPSGHAAVADALSHSDGAEGSDRQSNSRRSSHATSTVFGGTHGASRRSSVETGRFNAPKEALAGSLLDAALNEVRVSPQQTLGSSPPRGSGIDPRAQMGLSGRVHSGLLLNAVMEGGFVGTSARSSAGSSAGGGLVKLSSLGYENDASSSPQGGGSSAPRSPVSGLGRVLSSGLGRAPSMGFSGARGGSGTPTRLGQTTSNVETMMRQIEEEDAAAATAPPPIALGPRHASVDVQAWSRAPLSPKHPPERVDSIVAELDQRPGVGGGTRALQRGVSSNRRVSFFKEETPVIDSQQAARAIRSLLQSTSLNDRISGGQRMSGSGSAAAAAAAAVTEVDELGVSEADPAPSSAPRAIRKMLQSASLLRRAGSKPAPGGSSSHRIMMTHGDMRGGGSFTAAERQLSHQHLIPGGGGGSDMGIVTRTASTVSTLGGAGGRGALATRQGCDVDGSGAAAGAPTSHHKAIKACILHVVQQFVQLYGPLVLLFDNLHDFDSLSWQLLSKVADSVMIVGARRPASKRREMDKRAALVGVGQMKWFCDLENELDV